MISGTPGLRCASPKLGVKQIKPRRAVELEVTAGFGVVGAVPCGGTWLKAVVGVATDLPRSLELVLNRPIRRPSIDRLRLCSDMAGIKMSMRSFWTRGKRSSGDL